jgi:hypothetical protein
MKRRSSPNRTLRLNRETVRALSGPALAAAVGGVDTTISLTTIVTAISKPKVKKCVCEPTDGCQVGNG